jgi:eukaryotic-like serine/threonine-protein kinase
MQAGYILNERYKLKKFLRGDESTNTWLAEDNLLKRRVEITFSGVAPKEEGEPPEIPEFILTLAQLIHPNIYLILDVGWQEQILYVIAPHFKGELLSITEKSTELKPSEILPLLKQLAHALDTLHAKGFVHREVCSDNVMVTAQNHVNLLEFALMTAVENDSKDELVGTIAYIPPESLQGQSAGHLRDIWAFGIIVYECFSGQYPFNMANMQNLLLDIMQKEIPSVSAERDDLPENVDAVIKRLLNREPKERYQTAMEAVDDLYYAFSLPM